MRPRGYDRDRRTGARTATVDREGDSEGRVRLGARAGMWRGRGGGGVRNWAARVIGLAMGASRP